MRAVRARIEQSAVFIAALCAGVTVAAREYESPVYQYAQRVSPVTASEDADPRRHNHVLLLEDAREALLLRVHLIRNAQSTIDIQTTILANDECGRLIMCELFEAARRGVMVRLLIDHFLSERDARWFAALSEAHPNLELRYYRPPAQHAAPPLLLEAAYALLRFKKTNQRMHNKLMLFDNEIGIVGGRNIDNHYYNHSTGHNFIDRDAVVFGPEVAAMEASFKDYWYYKRVTPSFRLLDVRAVIESGAFERIRRAEDFNICEFRAALCALLEDDAYVRNRFVAPFREAHRLEYICDAPGKNQGKWLWGGGRAVRRIREVIGKTDEELVMQSPYLILNYHGRRRFRRLHRQDPVPTVIVSTNSFASTDNTVAYSANYKMRSTYIERLGFRVFELKPHPESLLEWLPNFEELQARAQKEGEARDPFVSIHGKSIVVDSRIAYVGSFNLDPRSENLNTENGVLIEDGPIARAVRDAIIAVTEPSCSWTIWKRQFPLTDVNYLIEGLSGLSPVDLWPLRNTTSFELRPGMKPVPPGHKDFYAHYTDAGSFPGAEGLSTRQIVTRIYKVLGSLAVPIL